MSGAATRRVGPMTIVLGVVVVALASMWVYALFLAPRQLANRLDDRPWPAAAEAICARVERAVGALPQASDFAHVEPRSEALRQRAAVGQQVTSLLSSMVDELRRLPPPSSPRDVRLVEGWLADYDTYLADRRAHVARWQAGQDPQFAVHAVDGAPITLRMDELARQNDMLGCQVPGDLG